MFILEGARKNLLAAEQKAFLEVEWPKIVEQISRLGLDTKELLRVSHNDAQKN